MEQLELTDPATGKSVTVQCSSETAQKASRNPDLLNLIYQQGIASNSEIVHFVSDEQGLETPENPSKQTLELENDSSQWHDAATKLLISIIKENRPKLGKCLKFKTKKKLMEHVAKEMGEKGYTFSASQVDNKYKGLERSFKNKLAHNRKTGSDRMQCPFEVELHDLFQNRASIYPECLLESTGKGRVLEQPPATQDNSLTIDTSLEDTLQSPPCVGDSSSSSNSPIPSSSSQSSARKRKSSESEELLKLKEERNKILKEKVQAYNARTAIIEKELQRRNELLEQLVANSAKNN